MMSQPLLSSPPPQLLLHGGLTINPPRDICGVIQNGRNWNKPSAGSRRLKNLKTQRVYSPCLPSTSVIRQLQVKASSSAGKGL
ncbi:hypothetical protein FKM82_002929 [Ascaphus truei]